MSKAKPEEQPEPDADDSSWPSWLVSGYGAVKARTLDEAVRKAKEQADNQEQVNG